MALDSPTVSTGRPATVKPYPTADGAVARRVFALTSIGTKLILAVTGLALLLFLPVHLAGNLLLLVGPDTFNRYAAKLESIPVLVPVAEIGLLALFLIHSVNAIRNFVENRRARRSGYAVRRWAGGTSRKSWASATMIFSGIVIGVFVPVHVMQMKFGAYYPTVIDGVPGRDLYRTVRELFKQPGIVAFYLLCTAVVGAHVYHGFASAFQSLGSYHRRTAGATLFVGRGLGLVLGLGFFVLPIIMYLAP